jgi:protein SCO1/2
LPAPLRDEVALVLVSFDVARDTPEVLAKYRAERLLGPQWTLLHGGDDAVAELAALLGVKYKQEADGQFAHSNLFTVLDRGGEIVHQRAGLQGGLPEAAAALVARTR